MQPLLTLVTLVAVTGCGASAPPLRDSTPSDRSANENAAAPSGRSPTAGTLAPVSERVVSNIDDEVELVAYLSSDLPPPHDQLARQVPGLLEAYQIAGGDRVRARVVNPVGAARVEAEAAGVREVAHRVIEGDSGPVRRGYRGLVVRRGDRVRVVPAIRPETDLEYEITTAIHVLGRGPAPVGVAAGHGSPTLTAGLARLSELLVDHTLREVDVGAPIDPSLRALLIVAPREPFSEAELRHIRQYVGNGGNLGIFAGRMRADVTRSDPVIEAIDPGLDGLVREWGVELGEGIVADPRCGRVPLQTSIGVPIPVAYPPAPTDVLADVDHPAIDTPRAATFFFVSPLRTLEGFDALGGVVLARSSEESWLLIGDEVSVAPRNPREWPTQPQSGPHALMVAIEGRASGVDAEPDATSGERPTSRVVIAGAGTMLQDDFLPTRDSVVSDAPLPHALLTWLAADEVLVAARALRSSR